MFGAIYTGLSGMMGYSKGLDVISNNVANLNTPGFKTSSPLFREIVYQHLSTGGSRDSGTMPAGTGIDVGTATMSFVQGELRGTGNSLDAAIDGNGFFVLIKDGEYRYTRAGQFEFNDDGVLVEKSTGAVVALNTEGVAIDQFDIDDSRVFEPRATTQVSLIGTLARAGTSTSYDLPNVTVYDAAGTAVTVRGRFVRSAADPLVWTLDILNTNNDVIGTGEIRFAADGTPADGYTGVTVNVPSTTGASFAVEFSLGEAGTHAGVTNPSGGTASQLQVLRQDGVPVGSLTRTEFDDKGQLKLTYSNGESRTVGTLVIARFDAPEQLRALGNSMFAATENATPVFGRALNEGLGRIIGGNVEMSNVELTQQFTDLIIMQRGYQASSQVSSVANELIQTLLAMDGGR
jgi:flagellar hook protein FlgE